MTQDEIIRKGRRKEFMDKEYLRVYKDKVVLVTGGAGAIGSNLTRTIAGLGAKIVIVLDNLSSAEQWNIPSLSNVMFVEGLKRTVEWFKEKWDLIEQAASFGPGMTSAVRDKDTK